MASVDGLANRLKRLKGSVDPNRNLPFCVILRPETTKADAQRQFAEYRRYGGLILNLSNKPLEYFK
ncbi:hypothetical protein [Aliagarivorans taiwanensis]|uniref:hypothetical protein n=1 Tax=Aliagarivorans taiwanensis TaxID=561966 RepID=UPI000401F1E6|nr:hypothetical protein [Aliagarivorans taiwanensis]